MVSQNITKFLVLTCVFCANFVQIKNGYTHKMNVTVWFLMWSISESNRWPLDCQCPVLKFKSSDYQLDAKWWKSQNSAFYCIFALQKGTPVNLFSVVDLRLGGMFNFVRIDKNKQNSRITISTGFRDFESAQRTLAGIGIANIIRKNQIIDAKSSTFKTFHSFF